ncbi:MAG TPA: ABC transporter permease subunit [Spirochaetia bacterium]
MKSNSKLVILVWIVAVIAVWELAAFLLAAVLRDPMAAAKIPYVHAVVVTIVENWQALLGAVGVTFSKAATGFALGAAVGYLLAVVMSVSRLAERIAFPYLIVSQMIPVLGLAPIVFNLVRDMNTSRVVIATYITFFPVAANTLGGFRSVEADKRDLMRSYAARTPTLYWKLMIPFSLPYLFAGLKIAAPLSVTASILVDMLGSKNGIGVKLLYSLYGGLRDMFWASVVTSALCGMASYLIVAAAERLFVPWQAATRRQAVAHGG